MADQQEVVYDLSMVPFSKALNNLYLDCNGTLLLDVE